HGAIRHGEMRGLGERGRRESGSILPAANKLDFKPLPGASQPDGTHRVGAVGRNREGSHREEPAHGGRSPLQINRRSTPRGAGAWATYGAPGRPEVGYQLPRRCTKATL